MGNFEYQKEHYWLGVVAPVWLSLGLFLLGFWHYVNGDSGFFLYIGAVVGLLVFVDHFVGLTHPRKVTVDDEGVQFQGFNRTHRYKWKELDRLLVRRFPTSKKIYLRIGTATWFRGRYWIQMPYFNDSDELLAIFLEQEDRIHPMLKKFGKHSVKPRENLR